MVAVIYDHVKILATVTELKCSNCGTLRDQFFMIRSCLCRGSVPRDLALLC